MNAQIRKVFLLLALLFTALVAISAYWLWRAPELEARQGNPTQVIRQITIKRGLILAADGTVLARNRATEVDGRTWYTRVYPQRSLAAQTVGYSTISRSRSGLEQSMNDFLTGSNGNLSTIVDTVVDKLSGRTQTGNSLVLTLDVEAQRLAQELLAEACGAAVALEPSTGRVLVLASSPSYDLNLVADDFQAILGQRGPCPDPAPLVNRGTAGLFTPGSTFKVITAAAALESGRFSTDSEFDDPGYCTLYGRRVTNFADQTGPQVFGRVTLAEALEHSVNSVFCNLGKELGPMAVLETAERFGFYERPPLETPSDERLPSGLYRRGELYLPDDPNDVDPGRLAFGQERMLVTPLQMAMVAAGIANEGTVMTPYVVERILEPDGSILSQTAAKERSEAVSPQTAADLAAMMELAVESGTGTAAQIPGVRVAGKTGTAETGDPDRNNAWFIGFAPVEAPRVAVAVVLSDQAGTGGQVAAPLAKALLESLLNGVA